MTIGFFQVVGASPVVANFAWTAVCGNSFQFTDTSTGNPTSWVWTLGGGGESLDQNPYVSIPIGTQTVTLTVGNGTQYFSTVSKTVVSTPPSVPTASFTATSTSGTLSQTFQFTDTSSSTNCPISRWLWSFGDGDTSVNQNPIYTFTKTCSIYTGNRTFPVTLTVYTSDGTQATTINNIVTGPPVPVSSFTATPTSGPAPLSVQFNDASSNSPTIWYWQFGDGTTSTQQNPVHNYTISGVYTVTMGASISQTCNPPVATNTITVLSPLAPTAATTTQTATITTTTTPTSLLTTTVTAQTTLPAASLTTMVTATPSGFYYTPRPTVTTMKVFTPIPTVTPTQKSPLGIEFSILAICIGILIIQRKS